jgi:putative ABC transport system permease protein
MSTLHTASLRYLLRHPAQLTLALVGLALGVGTIAAVDIATASAQRAFELSIEAVNGAATEQIVGGPAGVDQTLYVRLRTHALESDGPQPLYAPVLEGYVTIGERTLELLGIDPFASAELEADSAPAGALALSAGDTGSLRRWFTVPGAVAMSAAAARELGVPPGGSFELRIAGNTYTATRVVTVADTVAASDTLLLTDIAQAQEWLGARGRLSRIDVRLPDGVAAAPLLARLRAQLPPGVELQSTRREARATFAMTGAFTTNLKAMSLLALLVGILLIYGAVSFSVVQRRAIFGALRALGATRAQVLAVVLGEAAVLGVVGAACGVLLGIAIGRALVGLVSQTINDLYFVLTVRAVSIPPAAILGALCLGVATALVAALLPALEVAFSAPRLGLARAVLEQRAWRLAQRLAALGVLLIGAAAVVIWLSGRSLFGGFAALFLLLLGVAAATPAALRGMAQAGARLAGRTSPLVRLACRDIGASLSRTGVAVAALGMALAAMIGVAIMVGSFRESLQHWLTRTMRADIYVSAPGPSAEGPGQRLDPQVVRALLDTPGLSAHSETRRAVVGSPLGEIDLNAVRLAPASYAALDFTQGDAAQAWAGFARGELLISEPLAWRLRLAPHDTLVLTTASGPRAFAVAGVYREYGNDRGEVLIGLDEYRRLWLDPGIGSIGIYLAPGVQAAAMVARLRAAAHGRQALLIRSNADIRALSMRIFDRTFVITRVLYWLAAGVAAVGLLSALLAWELQRDHELALLRALGLTPAGAAGLVVAQTLFMGCAALVAAVPAGLATAVVLTDVINRRAFGWQFDLHLRAAQFGNALWLALAAALVAGLYPAWRSAHAPIAAGLREE